MSVIRANFLPGFDFGHDAVLLTVDGAGAEIFRTAINEAIQQGQAHLEHGAVRHTFCIEAGRAAIELDKAVIVWHLKPVKAQEITGKLDVLVRKGRAGHHYVDIDTPAPTLVLSRDEYVDIVYPWISPPSGTEAQLGGQLPGRA